MRDGWAPPAPMAVPFTGWGEREWAAVVVGTERRRRMTRVAAGPGTALVRAAMAAASVRWSAAARGEVKRRHLIRKTPDRKEPLILL